MPEADIVSVQHILRDGWHTFTSSQLPGLFVTGPEEMSKEALDSLPDTISALIHVGTENQVQAKFVRTSYRRSSVEDGENEILEYAIVPIA